MNAAQIRHSTQTGCILTAKLDIFLDFYGFLDVFWYFFLQNIPFHGTSPT